MTLGLKQTGGEGGTPFGPNLIGDQEVYLPCLSWVMALWFVQVPKWMSKIRPSRVTQSFRQEVGTHYPPSLLLSPSLSLPLSCTVDRHVYCLIPHSKFKSPFTDFPDKFPSPPFRSCGQTIRLLYWDSRIETGDRTVNHTTRWRLRIRRLKRDNKGNQWLHFIERELILKEQPYDTSDLSSTINKI